MRPFGFQLTNLILHMLTALGVWLLIRKLAPDPTAALAAVIFAIHPIHVESVTWMSARKDVLCLAFFLAAILLYERSESNQKVGPYLASILATGLALLSKLTAVSIPLCIFLFMACRDGMPDRKKLRRTAIRLAPHILLVILVVGLNLVRIGTVSSHGDALAGLEHAERALTRDVRLSMPLVVLRYIGLLIVPTDLSTHYDVTRISSAADPRFIVPVALILFLTALGIICFARGRRLAAFCLGWFAITFLPTANIIPAGAMMTDRYMHIPSVGFSVLLVVALLYPARAASAREKSTMRLLALLPAVVVALLFSTLTIRRNADWRDTTSLFSRTLLVNPRSVDALLGVGAMRFNAGDVDSAIESYRKALEIDPNHYRINFALGAAYKSKGWLNEAIQAFEKSSAMNPIP
jgi:4-amino-4-deoxy-L-arabinose transferase-like glycosyltransferase